VGGRGWACLLCFGTLFTIGCGGGSSSTTQQLRLVQGSPDAPKMDILIDGSQVATSIAYTNVVSYLTVKSGTRRIQALAVSNSSAIFDQKISVGSGGNQTLVLTGPSSNIQPVLLTDSGTTSTTGDGQVRVLNASTTMGAADVYVVSAGSSIVGATPVTTKLAFDKDTGYKPAVIGTYNVFLTAPDTINVNLTTGPLALTQSQNQTVVALDGASGGFTYLVLTDQ